MSKSFSKILDISIKKGNVHILIHGFLIAFFVFATFLSSNAVALEQPPSWLATYSMPLSGPTNGSISSVGAWNMAIDSNSNLWVVRNAPRVAYGVAVNSPLSYALAIKLNVQGEVIGQFPRAEDINCTIGESTVCQGNGDEFLSNYYFGYAIEVDSDDNVYLLARRDGMGNPANTALFKFDSEGHPVVDSNNNAANLFAISYPPDPGNKFTTFTIDLLTGNIIFVDWDDGDGGVGDSHNFIKVISNDGSTELGSYLPNDCASGGYKINQLGMGYEGGNSVLYVICGNEYQPSSNYQGYGAVVKYNVTNNNGGVTLTKVVRVEIPQQKIKLPLFNTSVNVPTKFLRVVPERTSGNDTTPGVYVLRYSVIGSYFTDDPFTVVVKYRSPKAGDTVLQPILKFGESYGNYNLGVGNTMASDITGNVYVAEMILDSFATQNIKKFGAVQNYSAINDCPDVAAVAMSSDGLAMVCGGDGAKIYSRESESSNTWTLRQSLNPRNMDSAVAGIDFQDSSAMPEDHIGSAVSMSGDHVILGAKDATVNGMTAAGKAYVYDKNPDLLDVDHPFIAAQIITSDNIQADAQFGASIALSLRTGNPSEDRARIIVGEPGFNASQGKVEVFEKSSLMATFTKADEMQPQVPQANMRYGEELAVATRGKNKIQTVIAVGAPGANGGQGMVEVWIKESPALRKIVMTSKAPQTDGHFGKKIAMKVDKDQIFILTGEPDATVDTKEKAGRAQEDVLDASSFELIKEDDLECASNDSVAKANCGATIGASDNGRLVGSIGQPASNVISEIGIQTDVDNDSSITTKVSKQRFAPKLKIGDRAYAQKVETQGLTLLSANTSATGHGNVTTLIKKDTGFGEMDILHPKENANVISNNTFEFSAKDGSGVLFQTATVTGNGIVREVHSGDKVDLPVGQYLLTYEATDTKGHSANMTRSFNVINPLFAFSGFFSPLTEQINLVKVGQSVPIKFDLGPAISDFYTPGDLDIFKSGPATYQVNCQSGIPIDITNVVQADTAGYSGLTYDFAKSQYVYVFQTSKGWKGMCRDLTFTLKDDTVHVVHFKFKQ